MTKEGLQASLNSLPIGGAKKLLVCLYIVLVGRQEAEGRLFCQETDQTSLPEGAQIWG